ncbi:MAG TPA: peptidoglycan-binding domain-containing protein, partial [Natronosporangium sp.]|nr:peptidoglycan-binding domain-containing protein [Natronosporangium sp.]
RLPRVSRWIAGTVVVLALAGAAYWAGRVTVGSPVADPGEVRTVTYDVVEATVGRALSLNVTVEQPFVVVGYNGLPGTVTSVADTGEVDEGDVLYTVDTVPVRAVTGTVPFWRPLGPGDDGDDVAQLQRALMDLGYLAGEADGRFGSGTAEAVRAWQRDLGMEPTGTVRLGEVVAVPVLPARLKLGEAIVPAARLAGGEPAVYAPTGEVSFALVVSDSQAGLIPPDATVTVEHEDRRWTAVLGESEFGEDGSVRFALTAPDGGVVCGDECASLPAEERVSLRGQVTIVPEVTGPSVPVGAVRTGPDGQAWVLMADGTRRTVTVLGSSGGVAVVSGLTVGERVVVTGGADGVPADGGPPEDPTDGSPAEGDAGAGG